MSSPPETARLQIDVLHGIDAFTRIGADWDALAERVDAPPFLRRGWFERWWRAFGSGVPEIVVAADAGEVVGVLPLRVHRGATRSMANVHSPMFGATATDPEVTAALWATALGRPRRRLLDAMALRVDDNTSTALERAAQRLGRRAWVRNEYSVPIVDVAATDWETYSSARGKSLRKTVRRHRRRLGEDAPIRLDHVTAAPITDALAEALRIEASGWKGEEGTAIASRVATRTFYTELATWLADEGWLRLALLRHGERAIAFELIVDHGGVWYPVKAGYDDDLAQHSPGVIMQWDILEAAFAHEIDRYDYCGEARDYTARWATGAVSVRRIDVFGGVLGLPDRAALRWARPAAKRLRDLLAR